MMPQMALIPLIPSSSKAPRVPPRGQRFVFGWLLPCRLPNPRVPSLNAVPHVALAFLEWCGALAPPSSPGLLPPSVVLDVSDSSDSSDSSQLSRSASLREGRGLSPGVRLPPSPRVRSLPLRPQGLSSGGCLHAPSLSPRLRPLLRALTFLEVGRGFSSALVRLSACLLVCLRVFSSPRRPRPPRPVPASAFLPLRGASAPHTSFSASSRPAALSAVGRCFSAAFLLRRSRQRRPRSSAIPLIALIPLKSSSPRMPPLPLRLWGLSSGGCLPGATQSPVRLKRGFPLCRSPRGASLFGVERCFSAAFSPRRRDAKMPLRSLSLMLERI